MAKVKERIVEIQKRLSNIASDTIGLPLAFRPTKSVPVPAPVPLATKKACDSYRVDVVAPEGFGIDVGQVGFDTDTGNVFVVQDSPTLNILFDRMDQKDRF